MSVFDVRAIKKWMSFFFKFGQTFSLNELLSKIIIIIISVIIIIVVMIIIIVYSTMYKAYMNLFARFQFYLKDPLFIQRNSE